jgi:hypothetical protein
MSHDKERASGIRLEKQRHRVPRHSLEPLFGRGRFISMSSPIHLKPA